MSTTQPHIFISHSHIDDEFGIRLIEDLRRVFPEENAVWYDSHGGLVGGAAWWKMIRSEIATRDIFLVVLSPDSVDSKWVEDEIDLAWFEKNTRGMRLIPLLHRACTIRSDLRTLQIIDFQASRDYELAFEELLVALGLPRPKPAQQPSRPPQQNLLTRLMPQIEASFARQDWPDVLRKSDYLLQHVAEDLPARLYLLQGDAFHKKGQFKQAQGAFEMALVIVEEQQQRLDILKAYIDLLFSQAKWDDAIPLTTEALDLLPNDPALLALKQQALGQGKTSDQWITVGNAHYNLKRYEEALLAYKQTIKLNPNYADAYYNKGLVLYNLKRYEEALLAYEQAIKLNPNYADTYYVKGLALYDLKRYEEALPAYEQAIKLNPNFADAYTNKGLALNGLKRYEEALLAHEQAIKLNPNFAKAYNNKGLALYYLNRDAEALLAYEQAIRLDSNFAEAYYNKGLALQSLNRNNEATLSFEKAKQLGYPN